MDSIEEDAAIQANIGEYSKKFHFVTCFQKSYFCQNSQNGFLQCKLSGKSCYEGGKNQGNLTEN